MSYEEVKELDISLGEVKTWKHDTPSIQYSALHIYYESDFMDLKINVPM